MTTELRQWGLRLALDARRQRWTIFLPCPISRPYCVSVLRPPSPRPSDRARPDRSLVAPGRQRQVRRLPGQPGHEPGQALGQKPRDVAQKIVAHLPCRMSARKFRGGGPGFHQPAAKLSVPVGAGGGDGRGWRLGVAPAAPPRPWWSIIPGRTSPKRCTSGTCAPPSSAIAWPGCCASRGTPSFPRTTWAIGARSSAC